MRRKGGTSWICRISNTTVSPTQDEHTQLVPYVSSCGRRRRRRQKRQNHPMFQSSVSCRYFVTRYHVSLTCHSTMIEYPCFMLFLGSFLRSILLLAEYHLVQTTATFMIPSTVLSPYQFPLLNRSQITSIWHGFVP